MRVLDGDTIEVMRGGRAERIRLYGIDAPEKAQAFGRTAKRRTLAIAARKTVRVEPVALDRYDRIVGLVYVDGKLLNEELVRAGLAWVYTAYCTRRSLCSSWRLLERQAKHARTGLWAERAPTAPWEWRQAGRRGGRRGGDVARAPRQATRTGHAVAGKPGTVYHGNLRSLIFHGPWCRYYDCKNCRSVFHSREQAIRRGYRPCKICGP